MLQRKLVVLLGSLIVLAFVLKLCGVIPSFGGNDADKDAKERPASASLEVTPIIQTPELPTGCESVALTMALNVYGYQLDKTTIAREWLVHNDENYVIGYSGDPFSTKGAGVFAPGLCDTANAFLKHRGNGYKAYDITGLEIEDLCDYIAQGTPVVVWITADYKEPTYTDSNIEYDGRNYRWYNNEHCVMLGGYDDEKSMLTVYDPLQGKIEVEKQTFKKIYDQIGKYAIMIN